MAFQNLEARSSLATVADFRSVPLRRRATQNRCAPNKRCFRLHETKEDLEALAMELNPTLGFYDPLGLCGWTLVPKSENTEQATIGWLRHAELKHGRVSMAAVVGFVVQSNVHFPWAMTLNRQPFPSAQNLSPPEQWDALPMAAKLQLLFFIGFLEFYSEYAQPVHYTKGGMPGEYPPLKGSKFIPHPVPFNLYDPLDGSTSWSDEAKAFYKLTEIQNGRMAMIGIASFLAESKVTGSVPALAGWIKPYAGELMAPFG